MTNNFPINISFRHKLLKQKVKEGQIICFHNCKLFRNGKFIHPSNEEKLWVRDGRVLDPFEIFYGEKQRAHIHVDCENLILAPGFLDIQLNGAFGVDFTTIAAETELKIAEAKLKIVTKKLLEHGVIFKKY